MAIATIRSINGTPCPKEPAAFTEEIYDISDADAGDSQTGTLYKGYIGRKRKIQAEWHAIPGSTVQELIALFQGATYLTVSYYSAADHAVISRIFVLDDRHIETIQMIRGREVFNLSFSLTTRSVEQ